MRLAWTFCALAVCVQAQDPAKIGEAWDALLPAATASRPQPPKPSADFLSHFYLENRADYWRYSTAFTGLPTATGIIDTPNNGVFNPSGMPYPDVFQGTANRVTDVLDWGTRGWLSGRVDTHFGVRYAQDVTGVSPGAPKVCWKRCPHIGSCSLPMPRSNSTASLRRSKSDGSPCTARSWRRSTALR